MTKFAMGCGLTCLGLGLLACKSDPELMQMSLGQAPSVRGKGITYHHEDAPLHQPCAPLPCREKGNSAGARVKACAC